MSLQAARRGVSIALTPMVVLALFVLLASSARAEFGVAPGGYSASLSSLQAGGHGDMTLAFAFNTHPDPVTTVLPDEDDKSVIFNLPPGLVGNPQATPQCSTDFVTAHQYCPADTQVGVVRYTLAGFSLGYTPLYNMVPREGHPAELGFVNIRALLVQLHALISVRTGSDYGITSTIPAVSANLRLIDSSVTVWGVPADHVHDAERGYGLLGQPGCLKPTGPTGGLCPSDVQPRPFLSNPTVCGADETISFTADSWEHPGLYLPLLLSAPQQMVGCDKLSFAPSLSMAPVSSQADAPSGYEVHLHVPQTELPSIPSTAHVKKVVVSLPPGVRVSPSAADGLQACSDAQIGIDNALEPTCPEASRIGTVTVKTPLLPDSLEGSVFEGTQIPGQLVRLFVVVEGHGVLIKLAGKVDLNPTTGQITTTFDQNPQLPFEDLILRLKGGPRAPLVNPATCGTDTTTATIDSWAGQTVTSTSEFNIDKGGVAPCPSVFDPSFTAGVGNPVAGGFSPFSMRLTRSDGDSQFSSLSSLSFPPGLLADVGSISTRCTIEQADSASCPASSHIGEVTVGAGAGPDPFYVGGDIYLTTSYKGNPFGIAVIVHAAAGPFDLGYVVVKGGIQVHDDGSITTTTDPFPTILAGVPLQMKDIRVNLDRPNFIFNPTNCHALNVGATVTSTEGQTVSPSSRFQVGECRGLPFHPKFAASTQGNGRLSHNGASLNVKIGMKSGPKRSAGEEEANIKKVEVRLPKALPSRLSTLQKACTSAQFDSNPAGCPAESNVGTAAANTPILGVALVGPAYLVSHGGAGFPDLVVVLQGEGITIHLTGHTQIKNGLTYSRFETVPDAPISSFELKLPEGPYSALAANTKLCGKKLAMPTTMTAQNGAVFKQTTKIAVSGCPKGKASKHAKAKK